MENFDFCEALLVRRISESCTTGTRSKNTDSFPFSKLEPLILCQAEHVLRLNTYVDFLPLADVPHQPGQSQEANEAEQLGKSEYPESPTCQKVVVVQLTNLLRTFPGGQNDLFVEN